MKMPSRCSSLGLGEGVKRGRRRRWVLTVEKLRLVGLRMARRSPLKSLVLVVEASRQFGDDDCRLGYGDEAKHDAS